MAKKSIYNSVSREKKDNTKTVCIVLGAIITLLVIFIVWCAFVFSDGGSYENTAKDVTTLKLEIEQKDFEINELKEKVVKLEEQKKQLELEIAANKQQNEQTNEQQESSGETEDGMQMPEQTENIAQ